MTLCPVAVAVGCKKCPIYSVCPLKGVIGDQGSAKSESESTKAKSQPRRK